MNVCNHNLEKNIDLIKESDTECLFKKMKLQNYYHGLSVQVFIRYGTWIGCLGNFRVLCHRKSY